MWPGARTPPTELLNSVSPVKTLPSTTNESIPAVWPGVWIASIRSPPASTTSPGSIVPVASCDLVALGGVDQHGRVGVPREDLGRARTRGRSGGA